jgi:alkylhydroperoxidase family enzyme
VLRKNFFSAEQLIAIVKDYRNAGLDPVEVAIIALTEKVILDQHGVTQGDIQNLLEFGLKDEEVLDIILTAAARSFYTKVLDSLGAEPDETYAELEPELRTVLMSGGIASECPN